MGTASRSSLSVPIKSGLSVVDFTIHPNKEILATQIPLTSQFESGGYPIYPNLVRNGRAKLASRLAKSLEETDPEVAQLRAAALAEIPVPDAAMMRAQLDALNTKYSAALDRTLAGANPQDQQDLMAEKNRLTMMGAITSR